MPITATINPIEESSYRITVALTDFDGAAVTPLSAAWSLYHAATLDVINGRSGVSLTPATSMPIILSGDDLAYSGTGTRKRILRIAGTFTGPAGALPFVDEVTFEIQNLKTVT